MIDKLKSSDFSGYVKQKFRILPESMEPLEVYLIEVNDLGSGGGNADHESRRPFSIIFRGPNEPSLSQGTYAIGNDEFGSLDLFIVPIGPDKEGMLYQAIFA